LVKLAAVKIAMIMCSNVVAQGCATRQHYWAKYTQPEWSMGHSCLCKALGVRQIAGHPLRIGNTLNLHSLCVCLIISPLFHKVWTAQRLRL